MNNTNHILGQIITLRDRLVSAQHANERDRVRLVVHLDALKKSMASWEWISNGETQNADAAGNLPQEVDAAYREIKQAMEPLWALARDLDDSPGSAGRAAGVREGNRQALGDQAIALLLIVRESIMPEVLDNIRDRGWPVGERIDYILRESRR